MLHQTISHHTESDSIPPASRQDLCRNSEDDTVGVDDLPLENAMDNVASHDMVSETIALHYLIHLYYPTEAKQKNCECIVVKPRHTYY